ncbi:MAG: V-type ATP synthase subunit D [Thiohalocapsa sp.]|uniref:V-type ATP synthase subunit D n=1 Tax=Thiohalocapsa sp. TaxID=2497641 RepID=UPI0025F9C2B9|nr:V-type ATP synthase subunit D [Thiohalocapsa sp.]MCG6940239.1 V-type ATP synthase subunit D [Thiohalocapsa sp.]
MTDRELVPTQSAFLELTAERAGMHEGYRFLDEKRLILAGEILANLRDYDATMARWREAEAAARAALRAAVGRHGLEELSIYPAAAAACGLETVGRSVLGVRVEDLPPLAEVEAEVDDGVATQASQSPEADACRAVFASMLPIAARLAVLTGNLERLRVEYLRTARRARALEDVLLPEMDARIRFIDNALEELEREEAVRVRRAGR